MKVVDTSKQQSIITNVRELFDRPSIVEHVRRKEHIDTHDSTE
jgi:hypothetical protein